jgi:hypothetical protein
MMPTAPVRPSRSKAWSWVAAAAAIALVTVGGIVSLWPRTGHGPSVLWHLAGDIAAPPPADASATTWSAWARQAVDTTVSEQAQALTGGDQAGYLAAIDPVDQRLHDSLLHRFQELRQMGIGQWHQEIRGNPQVTGELAWHADVRVTYCFGDANCRPNTVVIGTDWRLRNDQLLLTDEANTSANQFGPRPWETGDLAIATGKRTVVAVSARLSSRLQETAAAAEQAAAVADTLAKWDGPPSRYVVFLASPTDWDEWYGSGKPEWAGGIYIDQTDNEVIVNSRVRSSDIKDLLTHELTHVATLAGPRKGPDDRTTWWLVEGIAEYAMMLGRPVSQYDGFTQVRSFIKTEGGDPVVAIPAADATVDQAAGAYGVAFLAVRRMADRYGQDAMLNFWGKIVHDGQTFDDAARAAYGQSWDAVRADCQTYIRSV